MNTFASKYVCYMMIHFFFPDLLNFRQMLEKYKQQRIDIDKILPNQMLGMFYLKLHLVKNVAKPNCEHLLELVEKTMVKYVQH